MKKASTTNTSQDFDRKHKQNHKVKNPRSIKDIPNLQDNAANSPETADIIAKGHTITNKPSKKSDFNPDKREDVRHEHTNHFTNRASAGKK